MASSVRLRVLELIVAHLRTQLVPATARTVSLDLRGVIQVGSAACPAVFVVTAESSGVADHEPYAMVREVLPFSLIGYATSGSGQEDGVAQARENLLQSVINALYVHDGGGDEALLKALIADARNNNGNGAVSIRHTASPETDGGLIPPFGVFRLPCECILHYQRNAF